MRVGVGLRTCVDTFRVDDRDGEEVMDAVYDDRVLRE